MYYCGEMIVSKYENLRRAKELRESRDLPIRTVAAECGLATSTVQRVKKAQMENVTVATVAKLCAYFEAQSITDLLEWVPDHDA